MKIQKSAEDYLETMLMLQEERGYVRSTDVADHLGVTKPSVSYAVKRLREGGYITVGADNQISLTDSGMDIAARIYQRHRVLTKFLIALGVDPVIAQEDACKIEHDLTQETFLAIKKHTDEITRK